MTGQRVLFEGRYAPASFARANYDVHPRGGQFVLVQPTADAAEIAVVLDWAEELRSRTTPGSR